MKKESIHVYIEKYLTPDWDRLSSVISFQPNGIVQLEKWFTDDLWRNSIQIRDEERDIFFPFVTFLTFLGLRKRMITTGFFSLKKGKLEVLLQKIVDSIQENQMDTIYQDSDLGLSFDLLLTDLEKHYHFSMKVPSTNKSQENSSQTSEEVWLNTWMTRPHFPLYKQYNSSLNNENTRTRLEKEALSRLKRQAHHPHVKRVYYQLLTYHERFQEGILEFFKTATDPLNFTPEEKDFIQLLLDNKVQESYILIHHFIERLIEKKTKNHYSEAIDYIQLLQSIYRDNDKTNYFISYLSFVQKKYSRLAAFQKELARRVQ